MASNNVRLERIGSILKLLVEEAITTLESKRLGIMLVEQIKKRTRLGYGVDDGGRQKKLPALSDGYVGTRTRLKDNLDQFTTPKRSNLTATGQLLNSVRSGRRGALVIEIAGGARNKGLDGRSSSLSNRTLAGYLEKKGRKFFGLTTAEEAGLVREIKKVIIKALKAKLNTNT